MDARRRRMLSKYSARRKARATIAHLRRQSQDQRQLSTVLRSYRKANPYQIQPSSGRTVSFWRKTQVSVTLNQGFGFGGAYDNINWGFALGRIIGFGNGAFQFSLPVSNAAEFQALFDYYKINAVKMQMFYTHNTSTVTQNTTALPMFLICNDFDDIGETMTLNSMNERVGVRTVQFENSGIRGINHYIKPKPTSVVVQTNVDTGALSTANAGVEFGTTWLDCAQSNIVHNGIKVLYHNQGRTTSADIGTITFVFDVEYCFKGYR